MPTAKGCGGHSAQGAKWIGIRKALGTKGVKAMARKAARTRAKRR